MSEMRAQMGLITNQKDWKKERREKVGGKGNYCWFNDMKQEIEEKTRYYVKCVASIKIKLVKMN